MVFPRHVNFGLFRLSYYRNKIFSRNNSKKIFFEYKYLKNLNCGTYCLKHKSSNAQPRTYETQNSLKFSLPNNSTPTPKLFYSNKNLNINHQQRHWKPAANTAQPPPAEPYINHILHNARGSTESLRLRYFSLKRETETVYYAHHSVGIHFGHPAGPPGATPPVIKGALCGHENTTVFQVGYGMMY